MNCSDATNLITESSGAAGCKSPWERDLLEVSLLKEASGNGGLLGCTESANLIAEVSSAVGCKSPWEKKLLELGLLWKISNGI